MVTDVKLSLGHKQTTPNPWINTEGTCCPLEAEIAEIVDKELL
jgi:hypothetical protein